MCQVRHRVEHILNKDQIKHLKKRDLWPGPEAFGGVMAATGPGTGTPRDGWGEAIPVRNDSDTREGVANVQAVDAAGKGVTVTGLDGGVVEVAGEEEEEEGEEGEDDMSDLFVNNNRAAMMQLRTDHEDEEDSDDDDSDS